jgi:regulatory protein
VNNKNIDSLQKARNYAFLLLKFRLRSEKELYQRLEKKKFDDQIIKETLCFLKGKGFVDDNYFAKAWIESRLKKPLGLRRLKVELKIKGIDKEIIERHIQEIKKNYPEENIVTEIAKKRLKRLKGLTPEKVKRRTQDYLLRRGFSPDIVIDVINKLCRQIF